MFLDHFDGDITFCRSECINKDCQRRWGSPNWENSIKDVPYVYTSNFSQKCTSYMKGESNDISM